jgi:hypothetical protein
VKASRPARLHRQQHTAARGRRLRSPGAGVKLIRGSVDGGRHGSRGGRQRKPQDRGPANDHAREETLRARWIERTDRGLVHEPLRHRVELADVTVDIGSGRSRHDVGLLCQLRGPLPGCRHTQPDRSAQYGNEQQQHRDKELPPEGKRPETAHQMARW